MTVAGGLGMFLGGAHPGEWLHLLYALLAFTALPVASMLVGSAPPCRRALATAAGALVGLLLIVRLFMTG